MSDGMSDGRDYGPSLSKHGKPIISQNGKPVDEPACGTHGDKMMWDAGTDVACVACLRAELERTKLQVAQLEAKLKSARDQRDTFENGVSEEFHLRQAAELQIGEMEKDYEIARRALSYISNSGKGTPTLVQAANDALGKIRPSGGFAVNPKQE
jgi:hypothetical protein